MTQAVIDSSTSKDAILVPMSGAVIDSSTSKYDTNALELKYVCETKDTPVIYVHGNLSRLSKLKLKDLITGNYTIRLMVEEAEGVYI